MKDHLLQRAFQVLVLAGATIGCWHGLVDSVLAAESETVQGHEDNIYMIDFTQDGRWMATASGDNTAILWTGEPWRPRHVLQHEGPVYAAVFSPDGRRLVTASGDGHVAIYTVSDGQQLLDLKKHGDAVYCAAFSPDGKILATVGGNGDGGDTVCRLWDSGSLKLLKEYSGHTFPVYGVAFSPDGQYLATSSRDKTVRLWRLRDDQCRVLRDHTSDVHRCAFSPNSKYLATASQDASVRLWDVGSATCVATLKGRGDPLVWRRFLARRFPIGDGRRRFHVACLEHRGISSTGCREAVVRRALRDRVLRGWEAYCCGRSRGDRLLVGPCGEF